MPSSAAPAETKQLPGRAQHIVRLSELWPLDTMPPLRQVVHGTDLVEAGIAAAVTVVDVNGMVLEPAGDDMCLRPTGVRVVPTSKAPGPVQS